MTTFNPEIKITNSVTATITKIGRARYFLGAAQLSKDSYREMGDEALVKRSPLRYPHRGNSPDLGPSRTAVVRRELSRSLSDGNAQ